MTALDELLNDLEAAITSAPRDVFGRMRQEDADRVREIRKQIIALFKQHGAA